MESKEGKVWGGEWEGDDKKGRNGMEGRRKGEWGGMGDIKKWNAGERDNGRERMGLLRKEEMEWRGRERKERET